MLRLTLDAACTWDGADPVGNGAEVTLVPSNNWNGVGHLGMPVPSIAHPPSPARCPSPAPSVAHPPAPPVFLIPRPAQCPARRSPTHALKSMCGGCRGACALLRL